MLNLFRYLDPNKTVKKVRIGEMRREHDRLEAMFNRLVVALMYLTGILVGVVILAGLK